MHFAKIPVVAHTIPNLQHVADSRPEVIGKVTDTHGNAFIVRGGERIPAHAEAPLFQGDAVETQAGAQISLVFSDRETFVLKDKGMMALDEFTFDPAHKTGKATFLVAQGAFTAVSGDIAKSSPDSFRLATPTMTIGVRGTTVSGDVTSDGTTSVALLADPGSNYVGELVLAKLGGGEAIVVNTAGAGIVNATATSTWAVSPTAAASLAAVAPSAVAPPAVAPALPAAPTTAPGGEQHGTAPEPEPAHTAAPPQTVVVKNDPPVEPAKPEAPITQPQPTPPQQTQPIPVAQNHAPTTSEVNLGSFTENAPQVIHASNLLANARDADVGDTLSVVADSVSSNHGTVVDNHNGTYTFTPAASYVGPVSFSYTVSDSHGATVDGTASLTETASANVAPVTSVVTLGNSQLNNPVIITKASLLANATDANGDTLTVTGVSANHGTIVDNGDGTYTFTPTTNYTGPVTITYTVDDGHGGTVAGTASLNENTPPTTSVVALGSSPENTPVTITKASLLANATDANGDTLTVTGVSANHGTIVDNGDGTYTFTPTTNYTGPVSITYTLDDSHGGTVGGTASLAESPPSTLLITSVAAMVDGDFVPYIGGSYNTLSLNVAAGTQSVALGANALTAGFNTVDISATTGPVAVDLSAFTGNMAVTVGSGADTFIAGSGTDTITIGGVPLTISTSGGQLQELVSVSASDLPATTIAGIPNNTAIYLTGSGNLADSAFLNITNAPSLILSDTTSRTITLGTQAQTAGVIQVDAHLTTGAVTVDASGMTGSAGYLYFMTGSGLDVFTGSGNADYIMGTTGALLAGDTINGGGGLDVVGLATPGVVADFAFSHVTSVEQLDFGGGAAVTLGAASQSAGIKVIHADTVTATVTVDASTRTDGVSFIGGTGTNVFTGGSGDDTVGLDPSAVGTATIDGGAGLNQLQLQSAGALADTDLSHVTHVQTLVLANGGSATLGANAQAAGISTIDAAATTGGVTVDATAVTRNLTFVGGSGNDAFTGGTGNDTFTGGVGGDTLTGGGGSNTYVYTSPSQTQDAGGTRDVITDFVTGTDHIKLSLTGTHVDVSGFDANAGSYNGGQSAIDVGGVVAGEGFYASSDQAFYIYVTGGTDLIGADGGYVIGSTHQINAADLQFVITGTSGNDTLVGGVGNDTFVATSGNDTITGGGGFDIVDYSHATSAAIVNLGAGTATHDGFTDTLAGINGVVGSFHGNTLTGGGGDDTFFLPSMTAADTIDGGAGTNTITMTTADTLTDADFTHVQNVHAVALDVGGAVTLGALSQADGITTVDASSSAGSVVVDASTRSDAVTMIGGSGSDTFTGGSGADTFVLSANGTAVINNFQTGTDTMELDNSKFSLGSSGTLAAANYAEDANSANAISGAAHDFNAGTHAAGIVAVNDGGGGATLWYTADMAAASTANSHQIAHVNVDTTALDSTQFHLHV